MKATTAANAFTRLVGDEPLALAATCPKFVCRFRTGFRGNCCCVSQPVARRVTSSLSLGVSAEARVSLAITNTGKRRGTEIVQLYATDSATGLTLPAQQLVGFARVDLEPCASKTVTFVLPLSVLAYTGLSGDLIMEPGPIELSAGSSSSDLRSTAKLTVTGKTLTIRGQDRKFFSVATVGS